MQFPLATRYENLTLTSLNYKINLKGRDEQELQYMFPGLYGSKAVTKATRETFTRFNKNHFYRVK